MIREMLKSKLHHIRVTEANAEYMGSLSLDSNFIEAARLLPGEKIQVVNMRTADRFETYVLEQPAGSKAVGLNGGAAMLGKIGDRLLVMSYASMDDDEAKTFEPVILIFDENNDFVEKK